MTKRWKAAAAVVLAAVALTGCNAIRVVPTTTYQDGVRCMPQALSADGRWLVYTTLQDWSYQTLDQKTVLRNLSTGAERQLAGFGGGLTSTDNAISADGSRVVLVIPNRSASGSSSNDILYLWTQRSGTRTRITPLAESNLFAAMSADGRKVAYSSEDGKLLWQYDVGTATRKAITRPAGLASSVALTVESTSSNGRYVVLAGGGKAYVRDTINGTGWTLPTSGYELQPVIDISGDGRWVAFGLHKPSDPYSRNQLYAWDRTTGVATKLTSFTGHVAAGQPSIDADGSHIAFTVADGTTSQFSLRTMVRSTKKATVISSATRYFGQPSMAASGARGSFCSQANLGGAKGNPNLYTWG